MKNTSLELPDMLQRYFAVHLAQQRGVSPRTVESYRDTIRLLLTFLADQLGRSRTCRDPGMARLWDPGCGL